MIDIVNVIANELAIKKNQVEAVIKLLNEDATIPFIVRYRKEHTGGLDEEVLRTIEDRLSYLTILEERKKTVLSSIEEQGKLTPELKIKILNALKLQELEDLYLPFKPKRKTRGTIAKSKGLEPLAIFILENPDYKGTIDGKLSEFIDAEKGVGTSEEALQGAKDIIAEMISDDSEVRRILREFYFDSSIIHSEKAKAKAKESSEGKKIQEKERKDVYQVYYEFSGDIKKIKPCQILAINRGEKEKILKTYFSIDIPWVYKKIKSVYFSYTQSVFMDILEEIIEDSFSRLIQPSIEREVHAALTENADIHAIEIFASNLKNLLLQQPYSDKIIMGIDPGFYSGSKVAVIDATGKYLEGATIYPHPPQNKNEESAKIVRQFIEKYKVEIIAIGNGTASRETEIFIAEIIRENNFSTRYVIVNEAGASVYSASDIAKKEFPDLEASQRGNISIARRLLDPLAELVKIDPKSIGVGLYQHDVDQKLLAKKLENVVESCVNYVGGCEHSFGSSFKTCFEFEH